MDGAICSSTVTNSDPLRKPADKHSIYPLYVDLCKSEPRIIGHDFFRRETVRFMPDHDVLHPNPIRGLLCIPGMLMKGYKVSGAPCVAWDEDIHSIVSNILKQYFGQNLGCLIGNDPIVTKCCVIRAGFLQTLPVG